MGDPERFIDAGSTSLLVIFLIILVWRGFPMIQDALKAWKNHLVHTEESNMLLIDVLQGFLFALERLENKLDDLERSQDEHSR